MNSGLEKYLKYTPKVSEEGEVKSQKKRKVTITEKEESKTEEFKDNSAAAKKGKRVKDTQRKWDEMVNFYDKLEKKKKEYRNPNAARHGIKHPARILIEGPTGAGKTNMLLNIINQMDCFDRVMVFCKMDDEPLYDWLKDHFHGEVLVSSDMTRLPDLDEMDDKKQTMMVFDDVICMSKKIKDRINEYFIAMRKKNCSGAYLSQSHYATPKLIRLQADYVFILKSNSTKDFRLIASEYSQGLTAAEVEELYEDARAKKSFFWINLAAPDPATRFRHGFAGIYRL